MSDNVVTLGIDLSKYAVRFFLAQSDDSGRHWYNRFGSITWNERESNYSQPKVELYGLFQALRAMRNYLVSIRRLEIEVDAKYIKGMLANPDVQPNTTINCWIAGILLFNFTLVHIPAIRHTVADGLSRRPPAPSNPINADDHEEWIDNANGFMQHLDNIPLSIMAYNTRSRHTIPTPEGLIDTSDDDADTDSDSEADNSNVPVRLPTPNVANNAANSDMPYTSHSAASNTQLDLVLAFHDSPHRPEDMTDQKFRRFVRYVAKFFVKGAQLWRCDAEGCHKLVIHREQRQDLIRQAHNDLGHKGVFSVHL